MHRNSVNLDFIRSVAVLAVVLRHILGQFQISSIGPFQVQLLGIYGVMLFFVHTAHVLMFSLERLLEDASLNETRLPKCGRAGAGVGGGSVRTNYETIFLKARLSDIPAKYVHRIDRVSQHGMV